MKEKIDYSKSKTAAKGRDGDKFMAHIAPGEIIVPPVISDELKEALYAEMRAAGIDPAQYEANGGEYSINPETGLPEFGFLSKVFKVFKKVAPVALSFVPGIGPIAGAALGAGIGAIGGGGLKGAISGALGAASGGIGNYIGSGISSATGLSSLVSNSIGRGLTSAVGSKVGGGDWKDAALAGGISGLGSLYKGGAFNNMGKAFNESGFSGSFNQLGENIAGKGDVLTSTGGASADVNGGGGSSSYSNVTPSTTTLSNGEKINWNTSPTASGDTINWNPVEEQNLFDRIVNSSPEGANDMATNKNRGLTSLANAGIGVYSNNKAAEQLLKTQKQGLAALQPYLNQTWNPTDLENEPGYQFQLKQGQKGIDSAAAARGEYYSGDAIRAAGEYATGLADSNAQSAYSRWRGDQDANVQKVLAQYGMLADQGNTKANKTIANSNVLTDSISNYFAPEDDFKSLIAKYLAQRG